MKARLLIASALVAALLAVPGVAALEGQATGVEYQGGVRHGGELALMNVVQAFEGASDGAAVGLAMEAASVWGAFHDMEDIRAPGASVQLPNAGPEAVGGEAEPLTSATLDALGHVSQVKLNIFSWDGPAALELRGTKVFASAEDGATLAGNGLHSGGSVAQRDPRDEGQTTFTPRSVNHDIVLARSGDRAPHSLEVTGNFVIEIMGLHVALAADGYEADFRTGEESESLAAGAATQGHARLLRLFVEDGVLELDLKKADADVAYALLDGVARSESGTATFRDLTTATGFATSTVLHGPFEVVEQPGAEGLVVTARSTGPASSPSNPMATIASAPATGWILGVAIVVAIIGIAVREFRPPTVRSIEDALEAGRFQKAARLSTRVLRHDPLDESAQLSRAIAWSRAGLHGRVVRVLEPFLARHEPSDGTIHYVLGLAQHDLGQVDAARSAMAEAVRRTPALLGEISGDLLPGATGHSDAQAYT